MNALRFLIISFLLLSPSVFSDDDPLKNINQKTHSFNNSLDDQLASPIAKTYKRVTPDLLELGFTNIFRNVEDINIGLNNVLQGKFKDGFSDIFRFTINSSIGLGGLFDVASNLGLEKHDEDFGQTLAVWGMSSGPYIVLPGLGPSTMRDTLGMIPDNLLNPFWFIEHIPTKNSISAMNLIDTRARYLGLESVVIGDEYLFYKDAYQQSREFDIKDGIVDDDFDEFDDFN